MQAAQLSAKMELWAGEFSAITGKEIAAPHGLWSFLAQRVAECGGVEEDPDVVTARIFKEWRKVRVVGMQGMFLRCEPVGWISTGVICRTEDVHEQDRGRLSAILERIQQGKVQ